VNDKPLRKSEKNLKKQISMLEQVATALLLMQGKIESLEKKISGRTGTIKD